jgi:hypothetical protein
MAVCDDFESSSAGNGPDSTRWTLAYPNCNNGGGSAVIDAAQSHSGGKSIRIASGTGGYCDHVFIKSTAVATMGDTVYGRFWMRSSQALADGHVTFMALCDAADSGSGSGCTSANAAKDLRMGGQSKILMWNRETNDSTLPALSPTGISLSAQIVPNTWHCIEFGITQSTGSLQTWLDGKAVAALEIDGTPTADVDAQWLQSGNWRPDLKDFKLGWEYYGGGPNTLWYDDVALHTSRIGCGS